MLPPSFASVCDLEDYCAANPSSGSGRGGGPGTFGRLTWTSSRLQPHILRRRPPYHTALRVSGAPDPVPTLCKCAGNSNQPPSGYSWTNSQPRRLIQPTPPPRAYHRLTRCVQARERPPVGCLQRRLWVPACMSGCFTPPRAAPTASRRPASAFQWPVQATEMCKHAPRPTAGSASPSRRPQQRYPPLAAPASPRVLSPPWVLAWPWHQLSFV